MFSCLLRGLININKNDLRRWNNAIKVGWYFQTALSKDLMYPRMFYPMPTRKVLPERSQEFM